MPVREVADLTGNVGRSAKVYSDARSLRLAQLLGEEEGT